MLAIVSTAMAFDSFDVILDGGDTQSTAGWFTINSGGGYNTKYTGKYGGHTYSKGLKINSKSSISFKTDATSTITIVQSLAANSGNVPKLDSDNLSGRVDDTSNNVGVFTLENVAPGNHQIVQGSGETGLLYVKVEYTQSALIALESPEIDYDSSTGEVTIGTVANATKYLYTTDGQIPSPTAADTYEYDEPFIVADGTTVTAIAVDGTGTYANSDPTSVLVLLDLSYIAPPTINVQNGTFYIKSDVTNAELEYRIGNGSWESFTRSITLENNATVYARASRSGAVSDVASESITVIGKPAGTTSVMLVFNEGTANKNVWSNEAGYVLTIGNEEKAWSSAESITIGEEAYKSFKVSNGAQNTLTLPDGVNLKRMTFYSYINHESANARLSDWKEVNGVAYDEKYVPMGAYQDYGNPDVRVYDVDATGSVTFTNAGEQLCFVLVLDVTGAETRPAMDPTLYDFTQALSDNDVTNLSADANWTTVEEGKTWELAGSIAERNQYVSLTANGNNIEMTDGLLFTRDNSEGLAQGIKFNNKKNLSLINSNIIISIPQTAEGDIVRIRFASSDTEGGETTFTVSNADKSTITTVDKQDFALTVGRDAATTLTTSGKVNIFQIAINTELPTETDGAATAIQEVQTAQKGGAAYNLAGQRVANGFKGVVVKDGKKMLVK